MRGGVRFDDALPPAPVVAPPLDGAGLPRDLRGEGAGLLRADPPGSSAHRKLWTVPFVRQALRIEDAVQLPNAVAQRRADGNLRPVA